MSLSFPPTLRRVSFALLVIVLGGCHRHPFVPATFASTDALFAASMREYRLHHWGNAVNGFERLTIDLPARDPLLPQAFYYLGMAHDRRHEYILAAQAFSRVPESFPEDTLAAPATLEAGLAYARLWRRPQLDDDYGITALTTLQSFLAAYPDSPLLPRAQAEINKLTEWLAIKNYDTAMFYLRRKAYDPAIIYLKDIISQYPSTKHARLAMLRLAEAYRKIHYKEEFAETCDTLRGRYPGDRDVLKECGPAPVASTPKVNP